jgi:hypothetical protein
MNELTNLSGEMFDAFLNATLFRHTCPSTDVLLNYSWGMLDIKEEISVAGHLSRCPHCRAETAELAPPNPEPASSPAVVFPNIRLFLATLSPGLSPSRAGARGVKATARAYKVAEVGWDITLSWTPADGGVFTLQGQLMGPTPSEMAQITLHLLSAPETHLTSQPDENGVFVITHVPPGNCFLYLQASIGQIIISDVTIT